ncbi:outer membrane beta-barrel protein [Pontibacter sp. H259]|uniref:outer membrane beta-barrel protein n=1 Tax=Pontibacter sp. H259 TaxID=3133421 RepID=UPI0030C1AEF5
MNRKSPLYFLILCLLAGISDAAGQSKLLRNMQVSKIPERGIVVLAGAGIAAVRSDICGTPDCNEFRPVVGIGAMYKFDPIWSASINLDYVKLGASEKDPARPRNLSFRTDVIELTGSVMYNLLDGYSGTGGYRSSRKRFVVPYAKIGAGAIYYTATSYPGTGDLDESQTTYDPERKYPAIGIVVPFGGGLRFRFSDQVSIAPELLYHLTSTDYLDNVGPRMAPGGNKDHYGVAIVRLLYTPQIKENIFSRKALKGE